MKKKWKNRVKRLAELCDLINHIPIVEMHFFFQSPQKQRRNKELDGVWHHLNRKAIVMNILYRHNMNC